MTEEGSLPRVYNAIIGKHLAENRQMVFVSGPRQVGKTTACRYHADTYLNWDDGEDRTLIKEGQTAVARMLGLQTIRLREPGDERLPVVMFDELHKHERWKDFLKGFFDVYETQTRIIVTGSSRLDAYRRAGDSLMGRYFAFRMHPFSVAETLHTNLPPGGRKRILRAPKRPDEAEWAALWEHGGYPEPYLRRDPAFSAQWRKRRHDQLLREDMRELTGIHRMDILELLMLRLEALSGQQMIYSNLAKAIRISVDTARRWVDTLDMVHHGFRVRPWFASVPRSLRKEPKWYSRDWSGIEDPGARAKTFVACHLLKAVEGWDDLGYGSFDLAYLRDADKREVDFVVVRDGKPWFLVEVKQDSNEISPELRYFQEKTGAPMAFQVEVDADYIDADCFAQPRYPVIVPARTFLSQLF